MVIQMIIKTYSELIKMESFLDRYRYLRIGGQVGTETFGFDRYLNQKFYREDPEWKAARREVIIRDLGCDLAMEDREIQGLIIVHHMNPITIEDIIQRTEFLLDPEYLICVSDNTHKAIHYGNEGLLHTDPIVRFPNDTCPWRLNH